MDSISIIYFTNKFSHPYGWLNLLEAVDNDTVSLKNETIDS
jgi:hypothetical protein